MADNKNMGMNLTLSKSDVSNIDNTELVEAIKAMRADFKSETQNKVINLALRATFFVPAVMNKKTELVEGADKRMKFEDQQTARFLLVTNPDKGTYFPAFTDRELLKDFPSEQPFQAFAMKFPDLANLTERTPTVNGFIINPNTEKLPFTKEILGGIKQVIADARKKAQAAGTAESTEGGDKPNISVSTNENPEA